MNLPEKMLPPPRLWDQDNERVGDWNVRELPHLVRDQPVFDFPLALFPFSEHKFDCEDLYEFAQHMRHVQECDPTEPVIMNARNRVIDGRHRIVRAWLDGAESVPCKRLPENTRPSTP